MSEKKTAGIGLNLLYKIYILYSQLIYYQYALHIDKWFRYISSKMYQKCNVCVLHFLEVMCCTSMYTIVLFIVLNSVCVLKIYILTKK